MQRTDILAIRFLIDHGALINRPLQGTVELCAIIDGAFKERKKALFEACKKSDLAALRKTLVQGIDVNELEEETQKHALMYAIEGRFIEGIKVLFAAGAKVEGTASMHIIEYVSRIIFNHYVSCFYRWDSHRSKKIFSRAAAFFGNSVFITLLLEQGADVNGIGSISKKTALMDAAERGDKNLSNYC